MKSSIQDLPVTMDADQGTGRQVTWGGMAVAVSEVRQTFDGAPFFKGLPDDRCQLHHWGYVLEGRLRAKFADHEEVFEAGDLFYLPPGHTPVYEAGLKYITFTDSEMSSKQAEVTLANLKAMTQ